MATYACNKCGMAVNTNCAKCDVALVDDSLDLDNGTKVQIAKLLWWGNGVQHLANSSCSRKHV